ncbi:MAG: ABC transporter permease [Marmoricola sp.]
MSMLRPTLIKPSWGTVARWSILILAAVYFFGPLAAAISFTLKSTTGGFSFDAYTSIFNAPATGGVSFLSALTFSLGLAAGTIVLAILLMVPTQLLLNLYAPRFKPIVEVISLLPLVFPPVVLVVGVKDVYGASAPSDNGSGSFFFPILKWINDPGPPLLLVILYVVMAMPFVYRALNSGIETVNLRTLVEASRNLGAGWVTTTLRVVMPALRTSIVTAAFLCFALAMGEYTVAGILGYTKPFPIWLTELQTGSGQEQAAVSVFSLVLVELALLVVSGLTARRTKKGQA